MKFEHLILDFHDLFGSIATCSTVRNLKRPSLLDVNPEPATYSDEAALRLWLRGGFPRSYLAALDEDSMVWRQQATCRNDGNKYVRKP